MKSWSSEIHNTIDSKLESSRDKDILFFRINEFKRNISRVDEFSASCPTCKKEMINISEVVQKIDEAVNTPGKTRREYDRLISRLSKHMQKEHGFYAPYYHSYVYALFGIIGGFILGSILYLILPQYQLEMFVIGISVGLIVSYILGSTKDKKVRSEKKLM